MRLLLINQSDFPPEGSIRSRSNRDPIRLNDPEAAELKEYNHTWISLSDWLFYISLFKLWQDVETVSASKSSPLWPHQVELGDSDLQPS